MNPINPDLFLFLFAMILAGLIGIIFVENLWLLCLIVVGTVVSLITAVYWGE